MIRSVPLAVKGLLLAALFSAGASAQVTFNITYGDPSGAGFNDSTIDAGESLTRGQLRRNTVNAVANYLGTIIDGRGSANLLWDVSDTTPGGSLASFGPKNYAIVNGSFQNGQAYTHLRSGNTPFPGVDGSGRFDFTSYSYNYVGANTNNGSKFDMFSIALHEMTHGLGFLTVTRQNGQTVFSNPPAVGSPSTYGVLDSYLQRGNGVGGQLFNTNMASTGYGSFIGDPTTFTNGNDPTTGLFFGGKYAREVFGNPVPLYAPAGFSTGSSISHDFTTPEGVMNPNIGAGTERRAYLAYEIAMLLDLGYNVYNWHGATSAWTGGNANNLSVSPWRTDLGLVYSGSQNYNTNANPSPAPIFAPYAQVTSNIVLNFNGASAYTSTNDLGTMRMSRINLNSTASTASTITGGTLLFGQNSDGTLSVLAPKICQLNSGAFVFGSTIQIADPVRGLTVNGTGTGTLTFNGNLTGVGGLTKAGTFTMIMNGNANSYSGVTIVNQGVLQVNGAKTGSGAVTINSGGRIQGAGSLAGSITVNSGGVFAPGNSVGNMTISGLTMNAGIYDWELGSLTTSGAGSNYDLITLSGGNSILGGAAAVQLNFGLLAVGLDPNGTNAFWNSNRQWQIVTLFSGTLTGVFGSISNPNWSAGAFSFSGTASGIFLNFSPVPEPSVFALLFTAGVGWLLYRRLSRVQCF